LEAAELLAGMLHTFGLENRMKNSQQNFTVTFAYHKIYYLFYGLSLSSHDLGCVTKKANYILIPNFSS
jgi:hypothetical protein